MTAVVAEAVWEGFPALVLDNGLLRVTMVPELGGHIAELVDVATGRNLLWRNPRLTPRRAPYGAWFDDWWSGGWDEIFPSGDSGRLHGEALPYMGELWCIPWTASSGVDPAGGAAWIDGTVEGNIAPARFERRLELRAGDPVLRVAYRITSLDVRPLPFTWGIHPAFAVTPAHRLDVPASTMLVGVSSASSMGVEGSSYTYPSFPAENGVTRDVRVVRPREDAVFGGHWATDLGEGWLAMTDTVARRGIAYVFDRSVFPHAWLWQVYGGWRAQHHVALEAWTSHPMDIEGAMAAGRARVLQPGQVLETSVAFALHEGLGHVSSVERAGGTVVVR